MNETILVVDDELSARSFARDALQAHGYTVLDTDEPQEALQILRDQPVHLLVVDVVMPLMRGTELADRAQAIRPSLKVLLVSGHPTSDIGPSGRPLPVLDSVLANPPDGFGHIEDQALRDLRWQVHVLADNARAAEEWLRLTYMTADRSDNHARVVANLDEIREAYRRHAIVAVRMIRVALSLLKAGQLRQTAIMARRARGRHEPSLPKAAPAAGAAHPRAPLGSEGTRRIEEGSAPDGPTA